MLPYDFTLGLPERMTLPTPWEQEDAFKTLDQMNFRVLRTWNLPIRSPEEAPQPWHYVLGPGQFNEEAFKVLDSMFALANRYGIRVIFSLTADYGDFLGGVGTYAAHRGKKRAEFFTDSQLREDYKATLRYVLGRTNTITGVRYSNDKTILAWQFGNEMDYAPDAWHAEMGAYLKTLAPNQLVMDCRHQLRNPVFIDDSVDLVTRHLYPSYRGLEDGWPAAIKAQVAKFVEKRPLVIGEFGPYIYRKIFTQDNVVEKLNEFLDYVQSEPDIAGAIVWSMYFHHERGGFYWHQVITERAIWSYHWPGFPSAEVQRETDILQTLRKAAFRIQGLPVPPVPPPDAPELLPFAGTPMFSWRGSTGASGYDIERASQPNARWTTLAAHVSDADIAYRPLYSDITARAGETWFYRVLARNASGTSKPSNIIGPVAIERVCFVDELQDFTRISSKSSGLSLDNERNARYAEYRFRAVGQAGEWVCYEVPAFIQSIKVMSFTPQDGAALRLQVSSEGSDFTDLAPDLRTRLLPKPPLASADVQPLAMLEHQASVPAGKRYLRILWEGPAELDRVEIYHSGSR